MQNPQLPIWLCWRDRACWVLPWASPSSHYLSELWDNRDIDCVFHSFPAWLIKRTQEEKTHLRGAAMSFGFVRVRLEPDLVPQPLRGIRYYKGYVYVCTCAQPHDPLFRYM